jgi:hypothetical protein
MPLMKDLAGSYLAIPRRRIVHRPPAAIPATGQAAIFTVRGGPIRVWALVGRVKLAGDATATNLTIVANDSAGLTDVNLSSATAIASTLLGSLIGPQGAGIGAALTIGGAIIGLDGDPVVDVGTIDLLTSATNVMQAEWFLVYQPLTSAATVVPALPGTVEGYRSRELGQAQWLHRPAAALPQTAQTAIFTVKGGPISLLALVGKVGTVMGATATNLTVVGNSAASGIADVNLCTATAIANLAVGTLLGLQVSGIGSALATGGGIGGLRTPLVIDAGTIDLLTSASDTGTIEWFAMWEPIAPNGRLVLA